MLDKFTSLVPPLTRRLASYRKLKFRSMIIGLQADTRYMCHAMVQEWCLQQHGSLPAMVAFSCFLFLNRNLALLTYGCS